MNPLVRSSARHIAEPRLLLCLSWLAATSGCKPASDDALGPPASYALFERAGDEEQASGSVTVRRSRGTEGAAAEVTSALTDGFAAELMRTVFVTQQYVANLNLQAPARKPAWAQDAVPLVVGVDQPTPQTGLDLAGAWWGGPVKRPHTVWIGLPARFENRTEVVSTLAGRLGRYLGVAAATAGAFDNPQPPLAEAYQMAMQVIAREWRTGQGPRGAAPPKNDQASAALFAGIRENRFALDDSKRPRPAAEQLSDPRVAATFFYRLSQNQKLMKTVAPADFYKPLVSDRVPPGISPAAVLGAFRNLQIKLLGAWLQAVHAGKPPQHIADLAGAYAERFPDERETVVKLYLATTFGATVEAGGFGAAEESADAAVKDLERLAADVIAGRKKLDAALPNKITP